MGTWQGVGPGGCLVESRGALGGDKPTAFLGGDDTPVGSYCQFYRVKEFFL